ncbi:MAG: helix-turn-helix domain-containing protein [Pseudomonadota bacterium]
MNEKRRGEMTSIEEVLHDRNIIFVGADAFTEKGFTQVPHTILRSKKLSPGAKLAYAGLLSYAWHRDSCFPGQDRLGVDIGVTRQTANEYIKELRTKGFIRVTRRGQGRSNLYELLVPRG